MTIAKEKAIRFIGLRTALAVALVTTTATCAAALAQEPAVPQAGSAGQPDASAGTATALQEVVVTATRRAQTVQDVPISVTALTNQNMVEQGIKTATDLVQMVPGLTINAVNGGGSGGQTADTLVSIRGITSSVGAATTGIYLDDVPLQQRNNGANAINSAVFPQLFDLDRVEVLRGPQGTLYGGSSEGGTLRFISPQPSFTKDTLYSRAEGSSTQGGDPNAEIGVAIGGPLIDDTLAGHASAWLRHDGGYIDHVSQYTGNVLPGGDNSNSEDHEAFHVALAWKPVEPLLVTLNYYYLNNFYRDSGQYWTNIPQYQNYLGPGTPGTLETYCPCNFGPFKTGVNTNVGKNFYTSDAQLSPLLSPHSNSLSIPSITIDYLFSKVELKFISAYSDTINDQSPNYSEVATESRALTPLEEPYNSLPQNGPYIATLPDYSAVYHDHAETTDLTEELRATSTNPDARLSWVAGLFYSLNREHSLEFENGNIGDLGAAVQLGLPSAAGTAFAADNGIALVEPESSRETQEAAYGQATLKITQHLHLLAGLRLTRDSFSFSEAAGGSAFGYAPGVVEPIAVGSLTESPVTPLYGLQYVVDRNLNFYATAAEGFRPGGVNQTIPPFCAASLALIGYANGATPSTYRSDSLWSYELGSKAIAWDGRASLDGSVYYIDWPGIQTPISLACGSSLIINAAKAVSKGADLQTALLLFPGFTFSVNGAYTDSRYAGTVSNGVATLISSGSELPGIPLWSGTTSVQYRFQLASRPAFVRLDYTYQGATVQAAAGPGTASYAPDAYYLGPNRIANLRAGMTFGKLDLEAFVANLTNSEDSLYRTDFGPGPGRLNCKNPSCTLYQAYEIGSTVGTFNPRTLGIDLSYRY